MSAHNTIVLTAAPAGRFLEGVIDGTPKPGTLMQVKAGVAMDGTGRHTWEVFNGAADGERTLIAILTEDAMMGKTIDTAYASGDRGYMYCPIPGDELQVLCENVGGTADAFAVGDKLVHNDGTGKFLLTTSTPESEPFQVLEAISGMTADTLVHCFYTGY